MPEIGPIEAGPEDDAVAQAELLHHILLHAGRGRGCQRQQRHLGKSAPYANLIRCMASLTSHCIVGQDLTRTENSTTVALP